MTDPANSWARQGFIPLAEESGIINQLGEWVLTEAIRQLKQWRDEGLAGSDFHMAVNVSPLQLLAPSLIGTVERLVAGYGVKPSDLIIEITESTMMSASAAITNTLGALADYGVTLSIDDFGTGYSSLSYLRYMPVNQLKIDRSFVAGLGSSQADATLVETVIGLARGLGMTCRRSRDRHTDGPASRTGLRPGPGLPSGTATNRSRAHRRLEPSLRSDKSELMPAKDRSLRWTRAAERNFSS